jgi:sporulation inhibitor KapD
MDFFVADFEFTQYTKPVGRPRGFFSEIIEIGAVKIDGSTMETVGHIKNYVRPHFYPKQAKEGMAFCMITEQDMKTAIEFKDMLEQIRSLYVPHKTYFVAWGNADYQVVEEGCKRHALPNPILAEDYLDLAAAYKRMMGDTFTTGLRKATVEQSVDTGGLWHTAYDDAANTGKLLRKMLAGNWKTEDYFDSTAVVNS